MAVLSLVRPGPADLEAALLTQRDANPSYPEVGATQGPLPVGYRHGHHSLLLGRGDAVFERGARGLRSWAAHRGAEVDVFPPGAPVEPGAAVLLIVRIAGLYLTFACQIVYVVAEADRSGFAYGTLPRHLLRGEEAFVVERDEAGDVRFTITAFVRARDGLPRLVAPVLEECDQRFVKKYLRALRREASDAR